MPQLGTLLGDIRREALGLSGVTVSPTFLRRSTSDRGLELNTERFRVHFEFGSNGCDEDQQVRSVTITAIDSEQSSGAYKITVNATQDLIPAERAQELKSVVFDLLEGKSAHDALERMREIAKENDTIEVQYTLESNAKELSELGLELARARRMGHLVAPVDQRDGLLDAHGPDRFWTRIGIEEVQQTLFGNVLCVFLDKDNVGIVNDFGLTPIVDYLLLAHKKAFDKHFGHSTAQFGRLGGDELLMLLEDSAENQDAIDAYFKEMRNLTHRCLKARDGKALVEEIESGPYPFGVDEKEKNLQRACQRLTDIDRRVEQAYRLAVVRRLQSDTFIEYRKGCEPQEQEAPGLEFGEWLRTHFGSDLYRTWLSQAHPETEPHEIDRLVSQPFAEACQYLDDLTGQDGTNSVDIVVHDFHAFLCDEVCDLSLDEAGFSHTPFAEQIENARRAWANTHLMGTSAGVVRLAPDFSVQQLWKALMTCEEIFYHVKRGEWTDSLEPVSVNHELTMRKSDKLILQALRIREKRWGQLRNQIQRLRDDGLDQDHAGALVLDGLQHQALLTAYGDPGIADCLRVDKVSKVPFRALFGIDTPQTITVRRFDIPISSMNKHQGMADSNALISRVLSHPALQTSCPSFQFHFGGGRVEQWCFGEVDGTEGTLKALASDISSEVVRPAMNVFSRFEFYRKQALRLLATRRSERYSHFERRVAKPKQHGSLLFGLERQVAIDPNQCFANARLAS